MTEGSIVVFLLDGVSAWNSLQFFDIVDLTIERASDANNLRTYPFEDLAKPGLTRERKVY